MVRAEAVARSGDLGGREDEFLRLQRENADLKKANLDKGEMVKKLGVQLTRIRNDWQTQAAPKDMAPVAKARAAAEASKSDRISELQVELSQRDAKEQQLQRQLTLLKQQVGSAGGAKGGVTRQRRVTPRPVTASGISPPARIRNKSPGRVAEDAPGDGGRMSSLLAMVSEKDRALDELRARLAYVEQETRQAEQTGGRIPVAEAAIGADFEAVPEGAVGAELRRQVKKGTLELSLLEQRYAHLESRFNTLRDYHEKLLGQMTELNAALKKERMEKSSLQQTVQQAAATTEESEEKSREIERLRQELVALQDDNRRVLSKAFSNDDAGELARLRQELALKDAELRKLRDGLKKEKELQKQGYEAASKIDSHLALAHAEREEAKKLAIVAEHKLQAELGERDDKIRRLEERLALFSGDTGVPAHEIERALKMVRSAVDEQVDVESLRLADTDLNALGLSPLAKKEVQHILLQNNELIKDLEKAELLLKNQTKLGAALTAELEAAKRSTSEEVSRLQRREAQRTTELADAKRQLMQLQEMYSGREAGSMVKRESGFPRSMMPPGADTESVADSIISDGTHEEMDVRADENIFELRIIRASLTSNNFAARPSTFASFDFYQHDTQASPMRQGLEPEYDFTAQYVLSVDDLFLHYAATTVLAIEVYQSLGVECALVARTDAPLRELLQGRRGKIVKHAQLYSVADSTALGAPKVIGTLVYEFRMRRRIEGAVHSFMQRFPDVASLAMMEVRPGARTTEAIVTVKSASGLRLRVGGAGPPAPYVHFEFFEFGEQETSAREGSDPIFEQVFRFPVDRDGDFAEYLKQKSVRFSVFDEVRKRSTSPAICALPRPSRLSLLLVRRTKTTPRRSSARASSRSRPCSRRPSSPTPPSRSPTPAASPRARSRSPSRCASRPSRSRSPSAARASDVAVRTMLRSRSNQCTGERTFAIPASAARTAWRRPSRSRLASRPSPSTTRSFASRASAPCGWSSIWLASLRSRSRLSVARPAHRPTCRLSRRSRSPRTRPRRRRFAERSRRRSRRMRTSS